MLLGAGSRRRRRETDDLACFIPSLDFLKTKDQGVVTAHVCPLGFRLANRRDEFKA
jgi:hypothetical protein